MITAIVGKPGSGKSYYAVSRVLSERDRYKHVSILMDGVNGIPGARVLSIDDVAPLDPGGMMRRSTDPRGWVTIGKGPCLLVLDEVQRVWGTQGGKGQTLSQADREFFQQHRHYGLDVLLIAQSVGQITTQLALLVDRTLEIRPVGKKLFGGTGLGKVLSIRVREGADDEGRVVARMAAKVDPLVFGHYSSYDDGVDGEAPAAVGAYAGGLAVKVAVFGVLSLVGFAAAVWAVVAMTGVGDGDADEVAETPPGAVRQADELRRGRGGVGQGIICNEGGCSRI